MNSPFRESAAPAAPKKRARSVNSFIEVDQYPLGVFALVGLFLGAVALLAVVFYQLME